MKKRATLLIIVALLFVGCAVKTSTTTNVPPAPTLPTGARDSADANAFRVIADAYAFISSVRNSVTAGSLSLTATQKTVFNDVVLAYNTAYALGQAYHAGASSDSAGLAAATNSLSTKLTTASTQIVVAQQ